MRRSRRPEKAKQNLTLKVRTGALRVARELAARDGISLSQLFEQLAQQRAGSGASREGAKRELLSLAEEGLDLGGAPYLARDTAHER